MLVVVRSQLVYLMFMIVRTVFASVLVIISMVLVGVSVIMFMTMPMRVLVGMSHPIVRVFMGVSVLVRMFVAVSMFVLSIHSSPR